MLSREFLLHVLNSSIDSIFVTNQDYRFVYVSDEACRSLEYSREELLQMGPLDIDPEITHEDLVALENASLYHNNQVLKMESKQRTKSGRVFPVEITMSEIYFDGSYYALDIVHDISNRKRQEEALSESQQQWHLLEAAINSAGNAVYIVDNNNQGMILYVNQEACNMLGYTFNELTSLNINDIDVQPKPLDPRKYTYLRNYSSRTKHRSKYGELIDVEITVSSFIYANANYGIAIAKDITRHLELQFELARREIKFRSLAENVPAYIVRWDSQGRYLYLNPALEKLLGTTLDQVKGVSIHDFLGDWLREVQDAFDHVIKSKQPVYLERTKILTSTGEVKLHNINFTPEFGEGGAVVSVLAAGWDMTHFYDMQDQLKTKEYEFRQLADSSPGMMGVFHQEPDGNAFYSYVSPNVTDLFGVAPEGVKKDASALMRLTHPDDIKRVNETIATASQTMRVWNETYRILHPVKGERWMQGNIKPIPQNETHRLFQVWTPVNNIII
jgi:PAS domain S-box-containing protein